MKANDFRLGNYYHFETSIGMVVERVDYIENNMIDVNPMGLIHPIPLTEEWLLKFGFELEHDEDDYGEKFFWWDFNGFGLDIFNNVKAQGRTSIGGGKDIEFFYEPMFMDYIEIQYVHQLQNLYFALTGEELTLKEI